MAGGPLLDLRGVLLSCLELDACAAEPIEYRAGVFSEDDRGGTIADGAVTAGSTSVSEWFPAVIKGSSEMDGGEAAFLFSSRLSWMSREDKKSPSGCVVPDET